MDAGEGDSDKMVESGMTTEADAGGMHVSTENAAPLASVGAVELAAATPLASVCSAADDDATGVSRRVTVTADERGAPLALDADREELRAIRELTVLARKGGSVDGGSAGSDGE